MALLRDKKTIVETVGDTLQGVGQGVKEVAQNIVSSVTGDDRSNQSLDVYYLRELLSRHGQDALVLDLTRAIDFYNKIKETERWNTAGLVAIKNISKKPYSAGKWSVAPGQTAKIPDFEAKRILKEFPERFEVVKDETDAL